MPAGDVSTIRIQLQSLSVDCDPDVLERVRLQAWEGLCALGHGGLEVGGVLFGRREGDHVEVTAAVAVECEHALGPGFLLSPRDEAQLAAMLDSPPAPVAGLEVVGWYRSITRGAFRLTSRDEAMRRHFGEPWQIALAVKPTRAGPARGVVIIRASEGASEADYISEEFDLLPAGAIENARAGTTPDDSQAVATSGASGPALPDGAPRRRVVRGGWLTRRRVLMASPLAIVALLGSAFLRWRTEAVTPSNTTPLQRIGLRASDNGPEIRVEWDHASGAVQSASTASLEVSDGDYRSRFEIDSILLRTGHIVYRPQSGQVDLRLLLRGPKGEMLGDETTRHRRAAGETEPPLVFDHRSDPGAPAPGERADRDLPVPDPPVADPPAAREVSPPEPRRAERGERDKPAPEPPSEPAPPRVVVLRPFVAERRVPANSTQTLPPPPATAAPPAPAPAVPLPVTISKPVNPTPSYAGPASGRLIWTGSLERRGVIEIEEGKAAIGSLTGALPGVPVRLRVLPAQFEGRGLVVYSDDRRLAPTPRVEAASPANGWNRTFFQFDPVRARQIAILEEPNPANGFRRIVLRNDARHCSVVLVEWSVK